LEEIDFDSISFQFSSASGALVPFILVPFNPGMGQLIAHFTAQGMN
jgi:hypothetical protein